MIVEILIVGTIEIEPQRRGALLEAVRPYVERTRAEEPGCLDYAFMADTVDDDRIVVVERWADEESLAAHFAHPNMAATKRALHENGSGRRTSPSTGSTGPSRYVTPRAATAPTSPRTPG